MKDVTKKDLLVLLEIIDGALKCTDEDSYKQLILKLQMLINCECSFCVKFKMTELGMKDARLSFTVIQYPLEYLDRYISKGYHVIDPIGKEFFKTFEVQNWSEAMRIYNNGPEAVVAMEARDFGLNDGMTYGIPNFSTGYTTVYSFAGKVIDNDERTRFIIKQAIPHLSQAYLRILNKSPKKNIALTKTELEVLKWLKEGKTNWEVSMILNKNERTIKFHVYNIMQKLNAVNRTHAIAIALENNLISL